MTRIDVGVDVYYTFAEIAHRYKVPVGEVNITFSRWALEQLVGFKCEHPDHDIRHSKKDRYYCRLCYQFMIRKDIPSHSQFAPGKGWYYEPLPTVIDKMNVEKGEKETVSFAEQNAVLVPDRGDHEAWKKIKRKQ